MTGFNTAEEAVAAAITNIGDDYIEFEGMNCNDYGDELDECGGWDGTSRRCDCGNRRVSWSTDQFDNGKFYAYAVAY